MSPRFDPNLLQVYYVAKQCSKRCSAEEYAIMLGRHFVKTYPLVRLCFLVDIGQSWLLQPSYWMWHPSCWCTAGAESGVNDLGAWAWH